MIVDFPDKAAIRKKFSLLKPLLVEKEAQFILNRIEKDRGDAIPDQDIPRYIKLFEAGKMSLDGLVTHQFPLSRINEALNLFRSGEAGRIIINLTEG